MYVFMKTVVVASHEADRDLPHMAAIQSVFVSRVARAGYRWLVQVQPR